MMKVSLIAVLACLGVLLSLVGHTPVEGYVYVMGCTEDQVGETWRPDMTSCEECTCHDDLMASCHGCGYKHHSRWAKKIQDLSKDYPDCCPDYIEPTFPPELLASLENPNPDDN